MKRFLLVDDNEIFAALLIRSFARKNLELCWAADGAAALAQEGGFDGIILDLNLDGESGLLLLPRLRERFARAKIVILTGYASISTAVKAVKLGAEQYLPKPADADTILQAFCGGTLPEDFTPPTQTPSLQRLKWEHIQFALDANDGNISATARSLGMHRRTLQRMLSKRPVKK